jgi:hypothetical protein
MLHLVSLGLEKFVQDFLMGEATKKKITIPDYLVRDLGQTAKRRALREVPQA